MPDASPSPLLELLIPTIPGREKRLAALLDAIERQRATADPARRLVAVTVACHRPHREGGPSVGVVRRSMIQQARGRYIAFIDDDDEVDDAYLGSLLPPLAQQEPDAVGFWVLVRSPGPGTEHLCANSNRGCVDGPEFSARRWPLGIRNPVRTALARKAACAIPDVSYGEDQPYARALFPMVEFEVFVDAPLYRYLDDPTTSATHWAAGRA